MEALFPNVDWLEIARATGDTLVMLVASLALTVVIGLPLGIAMFLTGPKQLLARPAIYNTLSFVVNVLRSIPFIILIILMMPATQVLVGTKLGVRGAIPPLVAGAVPFFARLVETALREVDRGVIEAASAMGATTRQVVLAALLPEARAGLISAATVTAIALVSFTAMGGIVGAGGLGDLAYRYGYQSYQTDVMIVTVTLLLLLVQGLQMVGDFLVARVPR